MADERCYCGSGKYVSECCAPIVQGLAKAGTPEELMRARFTAHCLGLYDFLVSSTHPDHRQDVSVESISQWAQHVRWTGLEVHDASPGQTPEEGTVSFTATYLVRDTPQELREDAFFARLDERWYYVDGTVHGPDPYVRDMPRVGRNEPCPCGSGKKYKKCCAV